MKKKTRIKPTFDSIIREPIGKSIVPKEGVDVVMNTYWRRRVRDGSMVIVDVKEKVKDKEKVEDKEIDKNFFNKRSK